MAKSRKHEEFKDLGLGNRIPPRGHRVVNQDGSFNVVRDGLRWYQREGLYHWLINMPWRNFFLLIISLYVIVNLLFGAGYFFIGVENLDGRKERKGVPAFLEAFFLSTQTFTTVGYGRLNPVGLGANILSAFESMCGLLFFALVTGIMYGRFARPVARVLFSRNAVIAPYFGGRALMFRIVNRRSNQLIEVEASFSLSLNEVVNEKPKRSFYSLKLERNKINFFPLSWTIVHPIDEESPIRHLSMEKLAECDAEFIVLIKAFDDNFSQTVYSRSSYKAGEVISGASFVSMFRYDEKGNTILYIDKLNETVPAELPAL